MDLVYTSPITLVVSLTAGINLVQWLTFSSQAAEMTVRCQLFADDSRSCNLDHLAHLIWDMSVI